MSRRWQYSSGGLSGHELAALPIEDIETQAARWCIADLHGKGIRIRIVPMRPGREPPSTPGW